MILTLVLLHKYKSELKKYYSTVARQDLSWLVLIIYAFLFMWLVDLSNFLLNIFVGINAFVTRILSITSLSINLIFAVWIVFKALKHPQVLGITNEITAITKYEKSGLTREKSKEYADQIENYMKSAKPFLRPSLTISDLSFELDIPPRYLSQVLNESLNRSFFDYVNHYRIEEAKKMMKDGLNSRKTILEILYDSGFNSKSVFNATFKKYTEMTYRVQKIGLKFS